MSIFLLQVHIYQLWDQNIFSTTIAIKLVTIDRIAECFLCQSTSRNRLCNSQNRLEMRHDNARRRFVLISPSCSRISNILLNHFFLKISTSLPVSDIHIYYNIIIYYNSKLVWIVCIIKFQLYFLHFLTYDFQITKSNEYRSLHIWEAENVTPVGNVFSVTYFHFFLLSTLCRACKES